MPGATLGATLGKLAFGLRVVKTDGTPITWSGSLIRNLLRLVDGLLYYLVGAMLIWTSPLKQGLGDRVAKTQSLHIYPQVVEQFCTYGQSITYINPLLTMNHNDT